jgi:hypothetical protein
MNVLAFKTCRAKNKASDISWCIFIQKHSTAVTVKCKAAEAIQLTAQQI